MLSLLPLAGIPAWRLLGSKEDPGHVLPASSHETAQFYKEVSPFLKG